MAVQKKTLSRAYAWAVIGLCLGILGMHRYYLHRRLTATLLSFIFLTGVLLMVYHYTGLIHAVLDAMTATASGNANFAMLDRAFQTAHEKPPYFYAGSVICGSGICWWFVDLFLLPGMMQARTSNSIQ